MRRLSLVLVLLLPLALLPSPAFAQHPDRRQEAKTHFLRGVGHSDRHEWPAALAEFLASREVLPTAKNTYNAAVCLRRLQRFDEALDMYEALLREFPDAPADERTVAQRELAELKTSVGAIELRGGVAGAVVVVDDRERGKLPLSAPVRVGAGTHAVRVTAEGIAPFEARIDVAGKQTAVVDVRLAAPPRDDVVAPRRDAAPVGEPRGAGRLAIELDLGLSLGALAGGDVAAACATASGCEASTLLGSRGVVHGVYQNPSGFGFGGDLGWLVAYRSFGRHPAEHRPVGLGTVNRGEVEDAVRVAAVTAGGSAQYRREGRWPVVARAGGGLLLGSARDERTGALVNGAGATYDVDHGENALAGYLYLAPEIRVGWCPSARFEINVGVELLLMAAVVRPTWDDGSNVPTSNDPAVPVDGVGAFPKDALFGTFVVLVVPGIGGRFDL